MNEVLLEGFRHSAWATKQLLAACRGLSIEQLQRPVRGFGSILATLNHVILSDAGYAAILTGARLGWDRDGNDTADLDQAEARVDETARVWEGLLAKPFDAERMLTLEAGAYQCPASLVVVQALQHASAHREQIRAGLADIGVRLDMQPWAYGDDTGRGRWRRETK